MTDATSPATRVLSAKLGCVGAGMLLFATLMATIVLTLAIWPGEAKLTASLFCPDDKPDAFVVADTTSVQPGETSTSYTLYCLDERGAFTEVGWAKPFFVLFIAHTILAVAAIAAFGLLRRLRTMSKTPSPI